MPGKGSLLYVMSSILGKSVVTAVASIVAAVVASMAVAVVKKLHQILLGVKLLEQFFNKTNEDTKC